MTKTGVGFQNNSSNIIVHQKYMFGANLTKIGLLVWKLEQTVCKALYLSHVFLNETSKGTLF